MILRIAAAVALAGAMPANAQAARPPELLILGLPHFGNPGRDIANSHVEDVRTAARQREIDAVVTGLARFRPTRVAVEWPAEEQAKLDRRYADYRAGRYKLTTNEVDQIGLKLAARLGLPRVEAIDWNDEPPGKDDDYDFVSWAKAHRRGADWTAFERQSQFRADARSRLMACTPISTWLRQYNTAEYRRNDQRAYYRIAEFGDLTANPGAAWVGVWYARNLRIVENLRHIARSGDRILAVYGAGHGFLLDQQARESGSFRVMDTLAYLPKSFRDSWTRCRS
jgi:hypothetical protein